VLLLLAPGHYDESTTLLQFVTGVMRLLVANAEKNYGELRKTREMEYCQRGFFLIWATWNLCILNF
jgi:hypothetical protein